MTRWSSFVFVREDRSFLARRRLNWNLLIRFRLIFIKQTYIKRKTNQAFLREMVLMKTPSHAEKASQDRDGSSNERMVREDQALGVQQDKHIRSHNPFRGNKKRHIWEGCWDDVSRVWRRAERWFSYFDEVVMSGQVNWNWEHSYDYERVISQLLPVLLSGHSSQKKPWV